MCCLASMSPRSMRLASATSCSAVSSWTRPIERRYRRSESSDGSTVRSISGFFGVAGAWPRRSAGGRSRPSASSDRHRASRRRPTTSIPCSTRWACSSRSCSLVTSTSSRQRRSARRSGTRAPGPPGSDRGTPPARRSVPRRRAAPLALVLTQPLELSTSRCVRTLLRGVPLLHATNPCISFVPCTSAESIREGLSLVAMGAEALGGFQPTGGVIAQEWSAFAPRGSRHPGRYPSLFRDADAPAISASHRRTSRRSCPRCRSSLSRVGVTGVEKVIRIRQDGSEQLFYARARVLRRPRAASRRARTCRASRRSSTRRSARSSSARPTFKAETLAEHIAELVRDRQDALRAEVTIAARYPEHKPAPVSGIDTQEIYTLLGSAVASEHGTRRRRRRRRPGHDRLPVRAGAGGRARARAPGRGRLHRGRDRAHLRARPRRHAQPARPGHAARSAAPRRAPTRSTRASCCAIVEDSMSSEIYELMKRSDEARWSRRPTAARASSRTACAR